MKNINNKDKTICLEYRPDIDGLRAIAVISVVLFHTFPDFMKGGFIGVDIFFVISGFLISTIIFKNLENGTFSFLEFYSRRIKRIFPALLIVLIASYIFGWYTLLADEYAQLGKHIIGGAGFISNFILAGEKGYFDIVSEAKPLLHLWSLGIEEQFYIIWPLLVWVAWKRRFNFLILILSIILGSFILSIYGIQKDSIATFYSPFARFWELSAGSLLSWLILYKKNYITKFKYKIESWFKKIKINSETTSNLLSFTGPLLLVLGFLFINKNSSFPGFWVLLPVLGAVLIITAEKRAWFNRIILSNKIMVWFGLISFPLYLWHWPLLSFAYMVEIKTPTILIRILLILVSILFAWLTYKFIEHPVRFGGKSKIKVGVLIALMITIGLVGYYTYSSGGLRFRDVAKGTEQQRQDIKKNAVDLRHATRDLGNCYVIKDKKYTPNKGKCFEKSGPVTNRVLIFGDSNAQDRAIGFRLNGINTFLIAKPRCTANPLLAKTMKDKVCSELFSLAEHYWDNFDSIIVINKLWGDTLNKENISEIFTYWTSDKPVYFFTPIGNFESQVEEYLKFGEISSPPDFSAEDSFLEIVKELEVPKNIKILKTSDFWCENRLPTKSHPCSFERSGELMMIDASHPSAEGSRIMAKNMLENEDIAAALLKTFKNDILKGK